MKKGDKAYYKAVKSLGVIKLCEINENEISSSKFGIKITKTDEICGGRNDYYFQIEFFNNGESNDISIGKHTFSYIINRDTSWSPYYWHNRFTINYSNGNNIEKIDFETKVHGFEETICRIIYIFILLAEIDNVEKMKKIDLFLFEPSKSCGTLGERIDLYKETKDIHAKIIEKYPFMDAPMNNGLQERLKKIKEELLETALIENNLLD